MYRVAHENIPEKVSIDIGDINLSFFKSGWINSFGRVLTFLQGQTGERWGKSSEQAAAEQDAERLLEHTNNKVR